MSYVVCSDNDMHGNNMAFTAIFWSENHYRNDNLTHKFDSNLDSLNRD